MDLDELVWVASGSICSLFLLLLFGWRWWWLSHCRLSGLVLVDGWIYGLDLLGIGNNASPLSLSGSSRRNGDSVCLFVVQIAMAEMNGFDFNGRTIRVAYATASGGNGAPGGPGGPIDRRPYRDAPREGGSFSHTTGGHPSNIGNSYGGGNSYVGNNTNSSSNNNSGQVSRNLFVANIPPHLKLNEVEAFFDQYGEGT